MFGLILCSVFNWVICLCNCWVVNVLFIFWIEVPYQIYNLLIFPLRLCTFNNFIYLFSFGCPGSSLLWGPFSGFGEMRLLSLRLQASPCCGCSCCGCRLLPAVASLVAAAGFSLLRLLLLRLQASSCCGFSCCGAWALGCVGSSSCSSRAREDLLYSCGTHRLVFFFFFFLNRHL